MEEKKITGAEEATPEKKDEGTESPVVKLSKTYAFEGEKVSEIDFSGLENVTAKTMIKASKVLVASNDVQLLPENSLHYALIVAGECTKYPIEFYEGLCPKDAIKVKNKVAVFFYGEE